MHEFTSKINCDIWPNYILIVVKIPVIRPGFKTIVNSLPNGTFREEYLSYSPQCVEEVFPTLAYVKSI